MDEATNAIANDVIWCTGQKDPRLCDSKESDLSDFLANLAWCWRRDYGERMLIWASLWQHAAKRSKRMRIYINGEDQLTVAGASRHQILWLLGSWPGRSEIQPAPEAARAA